MFANAVKILGQDGDVTNLICAVAAVNANTAVLQFKLIQGQLIRSCKIVFTQDIFYLGCNSANDFRCFHESFHSL